MRRREAQMTGKLNLALIAAAMVAGATGCIVERDVIPDRPPVPAAPPPPSEVDSAPPASGAAETPDVPAPGAEVDEQVFYDRLAPYGHWRWEPDYGRVWVPTVAYGWRPYTYGRWVLTDFGWTFVSDDPFGWAAYHYGSWAFGPAFGWYWIPGRVWAPAWVSWRWGYGYACWAPIGPFGFVYGYGSPAWVVVQQQHFTRPIVGNALPPRSGGPIVSHAQPLAGPHASPAHGGQFGPPVAQVQGAVGHPIAAVPARAVIGRPRGLQPAVVAGGSTAAGRGPSAGAIRPGANAAPDPLRSPRPQPGTASASAGSPRYGVSNMGPARLPPSASPAARPGQYGRPSASPGSASGGARSQRPPSSAGKPWSGAASRAAGGYGGGQVYGGGGRNYGGGGGGGRVSGGGGHAGGAAPAHGGGGSGGGGGGSSHAGAPSGGGGGGSHGGGGGGGGSHGGGGGGGGSHH
jgi:hypothetical protein